MRVRGLDIRVVEGQSISDADVAMMWELRGRFMALKPEVRPRDDQDLFAAWVRAPGATMAIARDGAGVIQVYIDMNGRVVEHRGRKHLLLYSNLVFASEAYRNHPAFVLGNLLNLASHLWRHKTTRVLLLAGLYPPSFVAAARTFPRTWVAGEPDVPPLAAELVDAHAPVFFGASWLPEQRLLRMRTIPEEFVPSSPITAAILRRYERRNPRWREGFALLNVTPLTISNVLGCVRLALRRALGLGRAR